MSVNVEISKLNHVYSIQDTQAHISVGTVRKRGKERERKEGESEGGEGEEREREGERRDSVGTG